MHPVHLSDNPWLVGLTLAFVLIDILSWRPDGLMPLQQLWFRHVLSTRAFESRPSAYNLMLTLLLSQYFVFGGLVVYCAIVPDAAATLAHPNATTWSMLGLCAGIPMAWFAAQWGLLNWMGWLFDGGERIALLNRIYLAVHLMAAQAALIIFVLLIAIPLRPSTALVLLVALFIFAQLFLIYRGTRIFFVSTSSLCFLIVYLCALEIAPLAVLYVKMAG